MQLVAVAAQVHHECCFAVKFPHRIHCLALVGEAAHDVDCSSAALAIQTLRCTSLEAVVEV